MYSYKINNIDNNNYIFHSEKEKNNNNLEEEKEEKLYKCKKIYLNPTLKQKKDLILMMDGYRVAYNLTVDFINKREYLRRKNEKNIKIEEKKVKVLKKITRYK